MTETLSAGSGAAPPQGLLTRVIGVIFSPREAFAAVAARPTWLGAVAIAVLISGAAQFFLLSTDVGKELALDQQVSTMEAFGITISDEAYATMEEGMENARYTGPIFTIIFTPLILLISAGILHVMFGLVGGGNGTYKQVYAVSAHSAIISSLQLVFTTLVTIAAGRAAGANLAVFTPTLEDTTFVYKLLSYIDVFYVWSTFVTAVGLAVLYKRRTGPIAMVLLGIYLAFAVLIAFARSGS
ncbi:MAG TPA: YIP1 family protein [Vicinamibacterales bacterium]|jgi:hypothetical protein|nr:YIP1 family protein [Vicinamibacterales bacterium]